MHRRLAVLESEWWSGYAHTVKPFIEGVSQYLSHDGRADEFYYERFVGKESLEESIRFLTQKRDVRFLYIASHGSKDNHLCCPNREEVSTVEIGKFLLRSMQDTRVDGLLLGCCYLGNSETADKLMPGRLPAHSRPRWIAGYEKSNDWAEGTLLDAFFLMHILRAERHFNATPGIAVAHACNELMYKMEGICEENKFRIWMRQKGTGDLIDALSISIEKRQQWIEENFDD